MRIFFQILLVFVVLILSSCQQNPTILFEDNFESYPIGNAPSNPWIPSGEGTITVEDSKSMSGYKAVHLISGEGYKNRAFISLEHLFPLSENFYFGRMYMFVEEASPDQIHWTMIQSKGDVPNTNFSAEIRYGGQLQKRFMANYDTKGVRTDCWQHASQKIPEGRWFEVEWYFNGAQNESKLWVDGILLPEISIAGEGTGCLENDLLGKWLFPVMEDVSIGWCDYQTGGGQRSIWIDDVVISTEKLSAY